jgi:hypothetical protein
MVMEYEIKARSNVEFVRRFNNLLRSLKDYDIKYCECEELDEIHYKVTFRVRKKE